MWNFRCESSPYCIGAAARGRVHRRRRRARAIVVALHHACAPAAALGCGFAPPVSGNRPNATRQRMMNRLSRSVAVEKWPDRLRIGNAPGAQRIKSGSCGAVGDISVIQRTLSTVGGNNPRFRADCSGGNPIWPDETLLFTFLAGGVSRRPAHASRPESRASDSERSMIGSVQSQLPAVRGKSMARAAGPQGHRRRLMPGQRISLTTPTTFNEKCTVF